MSSQQVGRTGKGVEVYRSTEPEKKSQPAASSPITVPKENKLTKEEQKEIKELYENPNNEKKFLGDDHSNTQILLGFLLVIFGISIIFFSLYKLIEYVSSSN